MNDEAGRAAAIQEAVTRVMPGMTLGLGSGRAVFALTTLLGETFGPDANLTAVAASPHTAELAVAAGITVIELSANTVLDVAFDGADEVDHSLHLIKGGGAALLREKLVLAASKHTVILAEDAKLVEKLGTTHTLPIEVVIYGWEQTQLRVAKLVDNPALRADDNGAPVVTSNGNYLLDGTILDAGDLNQLAADLNDTLGVVEHGLFLHEANEVLLGRKDGTVVALSRA